MTAQIADSFIYQCERHDLIGMTGDAVLFNPKAFGMNPSPSTSACWRGYYCDYEVKTDGIYLRDLMIHEKSEQRKPLNGVMLVAWPRSSRSPVGQYKPLNGVTPVVDGYGGKYENLNLLVPFTGQLRLARGLIRELSIHMGFQKPTAYEHVFDLTFDKGFLIRTNDRSTEVAERRGEFRKWYATHSGIESVAEAFSLDMELK